MNPQNGTHGPPPPCYDVREESSAGWPTGREPSGHGASIGVSGRESRPHGQRGDNGPTAKGSRFPHGKDGKGREMWRAKTSCPCSHDRGTAQGRGKRETGEPDDAKVSRPVRRGAGRKGGDIRPRLRPTLPSPTARVNSHSPSESMRTLPAASRSRAHAANTVASLTATHTISSIPRALMASACCTKLGRCFSEQVRVKAPGTAKRTIRSPAKRSEASITRAAPLSSRSKSLASG